MSKRDKWDNTEIFALIAAWTEHKESLDKMGVKRPYFVKISESLLKSGYTKTPEQIQRKITNLRKEYLKSRPGTTGDSPSTWQFYSSMHQLLHESHYFNPDNTNIYETGLEKSTASTVEDENSAEMTENLTNDLDETESPETSQTSEMQTNHSRETLTNQRSVSKSSKAAKSRKRKSAKGQEVQEEMLKILKESHDQDQEFFKQFAKSQDTNTTVLTQLAGSMTSLIDIMKMQAQNTWPSMNYSWMQNSGNWPTGSSSNRPWHTISGPSSPSSSEASTHSNFSAQ